jgi:hypothetical protein
VVATSGVLGAVDQGFLIGALAWHAHGDWGEVGADDARANDDAVANGARVLSAYATATGVKVSVIIEADRSVTTALLPEEY